MINISYLSELLHFVSKEDFVHDYPVNIELQKIQLRNSYLLTGQISLWQFVYSLQFRIVYFSNILSVLIWSNLSNGTIVIQLMWEWIGYCLIQLCWQQRNWTSVVLISWTCVRSWKPFPMFHIQDWWMGPRIWIYAQVICNHYRINDTEGMP